MSRIYEALQRAELERKSGLEPEEKQVAEPASSPRIEEPAPAKSGIALDKVARNPWRPALLSLPTLAERGKSVEQFRALRSHIYQARSESALQTILVCSGMPSEGKSFVAVNLALSLARNNTRRVLLIDGDLRRPSLYKLLGAPNTPGLTDFLAGTTGLVDVMQCNSSSDVVEDPDVRHISNITLITAGECGDNSLELVGNHRIEELIATLSPHFDWIVIDSPPVLAVTDAVDLARAADGVLLVAREGKTPYDVAQRTQAAFKSFRLLGFVLNAVKDAPGHGYYYNYYNYYGYQSGGSQSKRGKKRQG
jgi:capsular exopolysaccharide synthesis family protein